MTDSGPVRLSNPLLCNTPDKLGRLETPVAQGDGLIPKTYDAPIIHWTNPAFNDSHGAKTAP